MVVLVALTTVIVVSLHGTARVTARVDATQNARIATHPDHRTAALRLHRPPDRADPGRQHRHDPHLHRTRRHPGRGRRPDPDQDRVTYENGTITQSDSPCQRRLPNWASRKPPPRQAADQGRADLRRAARSSATTSTSTARLGRNPGQHGPIGTEAAATIDVKVALTASPLRTPVNDAGADSIQDRAVLRLTPPPSTKERRPCHASERPHGEEGFTMIMTVIGLIADRDAGRGRGHRGQRRLPLGPCRDLEQQTGLRGGQGRDRRIRLPPAHQQRLLGRMHRTCAAERGQPAGLDGEAAGPSPGRPAARIRDRTDPGHRPVDLRTAVNDRTATASMLEAPEPLKGTFRIRSTGFSGNAKSSIIATFKPASFLDYVYFTQLETSDPVTYGTEELDRSGRTPVHEERSAKTATPRRLAQRTGRSHHRLGHQQRQVLRHDLLRRRRQDQGPDAHQRRLRDLREPDPRPQCQRPDRGQRPRPRQAGSRADESSPNIRLELQRQQHELQRHRPGQRAGARSRRRPTRNWRRSPNRPSGSKARSRSASTARR